MRSVGFIGVGAMGQHMSANLLKAGYDVVVNDLIPERVAQLVAKGARAGRSPRRVAELCEAVVTMLPSSPDVEAVLLQKDGVLAGAHEGSVVVDMSTIDPVISRRLAEAAAAKGVPMLDAPVSGGTYGAESGALSIMVGGDEGAFRRCLPLLEVMGAKESIFHVGGNGMGLVVKLCNNLITGVTMLAISEAFAFGVKAGADPRTIYEVLSKSTANSWQLRARLPYANVVPNSPANQDFAPGFMTDLMHKDLGLVLSAARALKVPMLAGALAEQLYGATRAAGHGRKDYSTVSLLIRGLAEDE